MIETPRTNKDKKIAVLAFHGMGGHQPLATLTDAARVVAKSFFYDSNTKTFSQPYQQSTITAHTPARKTGDGTEKISHLTIAPPKDSDYPPIDVFECYYSSVPKGKVKIMAVVQFLFSAGWNSLGNQEFKRRVFGKEQPYSPNSQAHLSFLSIILGLVAILVINFLFLAQIALMQKEQLVWNEPATDIRAQLVQIMGFNITYLAFIGALIGKNNAKNTATKTDNPDQVAQIQKLGFLYYASTATPILLFLSLANLLPIPWPDQANSIYWIPLCLGRLLSILGAIFLLTKLLTKSRKNLGPRIKIFLTLAFLTWLAAFVLNVMVNGQDLEAYNVLFSKQILNVDFILSGLVFLAVSAFARYFFLDFAGDVVSYIRGSGPTEFAPVRKEVQTRATKTINSLLEQGYDLAIYAHSLGSIVAYDAVNLVELQNPAPSQDTPQIRSLVTLGCPLDKVAYVFKAEDPTEGKLRDLLVGSLQPLLDPAVRDRLRWINVYSNTDIVAGRLDYFDPEGVSKDFQPHELNQPGNEVRNLHDRYNLAPLMSHSVYHLYPAMPYAMGAAIQHIFEVPSPSALSETSIFKSDTPVPGAKLMVQSITVQDDQESQGQP